LTRVGALELHSGVLALRSDFTPALARLVQGHYSNAKRPLRFQYYGKVWHAVEPEIARTRELTQIGLELVGVSNARADAELIHLARESIRTVGLTPRVEIGNPGFVRALFELARIPEDQREAIANALDHKDQSSLEALLKPLPLAQNLKQALLTVPDLYGDVSILKEAHALAPWPQTKLELDRLDAILAEFEDSSELLLDLGMARRLSYYTSMTFRAYTFDFGQPLLGGGRYDGALLPYAAGFTLGLERLLSALPTKAQIQAPLVLTLDDIPARVLRKAGFVVERALSTDLNEARSYAKARGIAYLLTELGLEPLGEKRPYQQELVTLLGAQDA
jgi:ATP phosphoribosyltransferase regulatory subunit